MVVPRDGENCGGSNAGEIMLFGVRVVVDSMRKSVSLNNLSQYEHPQGSGNNINRENNNEKDTIAAGYASADDVVNRSSANNRERKRGVPWTEEEHKRFLIGLEKLGKGDWRGIAKNFVKTRTPTQVASHAQKYYIRRSNVNRRRRRSSLFDITTDSVAATLNDVQPVNQDNISQSTAPISEQTFSNDITGIRSWIPTLPVDAGQFPMPMVYPLTVSPVVLPCAAAVESKMENKSLHPMQILHIPPATARNTAEYDLNMNSVIEPSLSLNLSLSSSSSSSSSSSDQDKVSSSRQRQQHSAIHIIPNCGASILGMA